MKTDKELVELAKQGKRVPIWDLVKKYQPRAVQWAYHNLYGIENESERALAAEDVAQEALEKAWRNIRYCDGRFYSWLRGIVKRECVNEIRARERKKEIALVDDMQEEYEEETLLGADGSMEAYELSMAIKKAVGLLPEGQRDVIKLRRLGYREREIAEKLRISVKAVEIRLNRGREFMDQYLRGLGLVEEIDDRKKPLKSDTVSEGTKRGQSNARPNLSPA